MPDLQPTDFLRLLETPTREGLEYWISQGERSVWPNVSLLRVRCAIEVELDRCYQLVRRRKPLDAMGGGPEHVGAGALELAVKARDDGGVGGGGGGARKRVRASSVGQE